MTPRLASHETLASWTERAVQESLAIGALIPVGYEYGEADLSPTERAAINAQVARSMARLYA